MPVSGYTRAPAARAPVHVPTPAGWKTTSNDAVSRGRNSAPLADAGGSVNPLPRVEIGGTINGSDVRFVTMTRRDMGVSTSTVPKFSPALDSVAPSTWKVRLGITVAV